jgi:hypothetical protein
MKRYQRDGQKPRRGTEGDGQDAEQQADSDNQRVIPFSAGTLLSVV